MDGGLLWHQGAFIVDRRRLNRFSCCDCSWCRGEKFLVRGLRRNNQKFKEQLRYLKRNHTFPHDSSLLMKYIYLKKIKCKYFLSRIEFLRSNNRDGYRATLKSWWIQDVTSSHFKWSFLTVSHLWLILWSSCDVSSHSCITWKNRVRNVRCLLRWFRLKKKLDPSARGADDVGYSIFLIDSFRYVRDHFICAPCWPLHQVVHENQIYLVI